MIHACLIVIRVMGISKSCITLMLVIAGRLGSYKYLNKLRDATMPPMVVVVFSRLFTFHFGACSSHQRTFGFS